MKLTLFLAGVVVLLIAGSYLIIPGQVNIVVTKTVRCTASGAGRAIVEASNWERWQRGEQRVFELTGKYYHAAELGFDQPGSGRRDSGRVNILPLTLDSLLLQWTCVVPTSGNPFLRYARYREAVGLKKAAEVMLGNARAWMEKKENVYGIDVWNAISKDSVVLMTTLKTTGYPDTKDIYKKIAELRKYIAAHGAKETDHPMLNVAVLEGGQFESKIAIATDVALDGNAVFKQKRFVPWKVVVGQTKGGPWMAERAMKQLRQYLTDYEKVTMALPFQLLVTERDQQPDSTRWVTQVIQPVS